MTLTQRQARRLATSSSMTSVAPPPTDWMRLHAGDDRPTT